MTNEPSLGPAAPSLPAELPVLPLREMIVFPLAVAPVIVGQERSVRLIDDVMRGGRLLVLVAQRNPEASPAGPDDVYRVGTAAAIHQFLRAPDGTLRLIVQGLERIRITEFAQTEPYLSARIEPAPERDLEGIETEALARTVRDLFRRLVGLMQEMPDELAAAAEALPEPRHVAYLVGSSLPIELAARQEILELDSVAAKLRRLIELLQHELAVRELGRQIATETQEKLSKAQRDYYLREQLKSIQRELGEEDPERAEAAELRRRFEEAPLPEEVRKEGERELIRLERIPAVSPEHGLIRTYLDWLLALPWGQTSGNAIDVKLARQVLDEDHYDLEKIKDRILEYLAVRRLRQERQARLAEAGGTADEAGREPILCFLGPPGVGKTSLGQSIARAMGRRFLRISLGGVHDEAEIRGHRRTYIGAMPGRIVQGLRRIGVIDPVFMLDEVDKLGAGFQGDPSAALLEVLDPAQNHAFVDTYLGVPIDLSRVLFICTANNAETIPPPLLDRVEVLSLSGYTEAEKLEIARRYLVTKQWRAHGLTEGEVEVDDAAIRRTIREYTREAGVRNLERELASLVRKAARQIAEGAATPIRIGAEQVPAYLGRPRFADEVAERTDRPGVATGLAWTPVGGDVLFVEATMMPGQEERLILTGMLGDVMRESAQAALSYLRANAVRLGIDPRAFAGKIVHIHVPAGAVPKDGPSAGVTMVAALASAATGRPVRNDTAMTGEITLRGKVLPVGGIKEKMLAAHRAGVKQVLLPRRNLDDLEDVPADVRAEMEFTGLDSAEEVLERALVPVVDLTPSVPLP